MDLNGFLPKQETRAINIKRTVSFFFLIGALLSFNLWRSDRLFPLAPVLNLFPKLSSPLDLALPGFLLLALAINCFSSKRIFNHLALLLVFLLALQDQNRWQPWVYIYTLCLLPFSVFRKDDILNPKNLTYFQLLLIGIYGWSGIHKLNANFIQFTFQDILTKLFGIQDPGLLHSLKPWGYGIGILEILTGLFLLLPHTRKAGVLLAIATHLFILIYLSPLGVNRNYIVFPWNLAMIILVYLAFWKVSNNPLRWDFNVVKATFLNGFALAVAWLLPALNFVGYWDNYLAFSLYSEKVNDYYIIVEQSALPKIDKALNAYFLKSDQLQGGQIIDVNKWAYAEMNVPFYPETRVFRQICLPFCRLNIPEGKLYFLELEKPAATGKFYRFTCQELTP